jgi:hypothetical protein
MGLVRCRTSPYRVIGSVDYFVVCIITIVIHEENKVLQPISVF